MNKSRLIEQFGMLQCMFCLILGSVYVPTVGTKFTQAMVKPWLKSMER